ncbi:MAG TPA: hypothetical protein VGH89_07850 [Pseudonocardia sp.]|jgi:hypothetical protein
MQRRPLTESELSELDREVAELAWRWARRLTGLTSAQAPLGPMDPGIPEADRAAAHLARLHVLAKVRDCADHRANWDGTEAGLAGVPYPEILRMLESG